ncbi:hypothetical protein V501_01916 [Pseudogymnoascus sp. VKM F-4519 (FW-2642)]|nr:hypothetical protein V501_01916 [Pseudogymnoascus sp. VKM F-4519 (FW-2642)]
MATCPGAARASSLEAANQLACASPEPFFQWSLPSPLTSNGSIGAPPSPHPRPPSPHLRRSRPRRLPFRPFSAPAPAQQGARVEVGGVGVGFEGGGGEGGADVGTTTMPPLCCSGGGGEGGADVGTATMPPLCCSGGGVTES